MNEERNLEILQEVLAAHVVDLPPQKIGNQHEISQIGDALYGVSRANIGRCDPSLETPYVALQAGKSVVLVGPNGAGKSTFFDGVMDRGAMFSDDADGVGGFVIAESLYQRSGLRIARLDQEEMIGDLGDAEVSWVVAQVRKHYHDQFDQDWEDFDAYDQNMRNCEAQQRIDKLLDKMLDFFEMRQFMDRNVCELSGGERTKLVLLIVLASEPDILLLDEPTNHLDLSSIAKLVGLFDQYRKAGVAVVSVSHVDWFLRDAGRHGTLEISFNGDNRRVVTSSGSSYVAYASNASRKSGSVLKSPIEWYCKSLNKGELVTSKDSVFDVPHSPLKGVSFTTVASGDVVLISGKNGAGKTKLLEQIALPGESSVMEPVNKPKIAYLPQFWPDYLDGIPLEDVTVDQFFWWVKDHCDPTGDLQNKDYFINRLRHVGFGGGKIRLDRSFLDRKLLSLSGGEQRALWFVVVSVFAEVDLLVLDEPTNHMDRNLQGRILEAIRNFKGAVVVSSHDVDLMQALIQDTGTKLGAGQCRHIVFWKEDGVSEVYETDDDPQEYFDSVMATARKAASRIRFE